MDWLNEFIIPLIQMIVFMGLVIGFLFILIRAIRKKWKTKWKFNKKYKKGMNSIKKPHLELLNNLPKKTKIDELTKELLISGIELDEVQEILYLYKKYGGIEKNVRQIEGSNSKTKEKRRRFRFKWV